MIYAVLDTNVIVAALLSRHSDASTVRVVGSIGKSKLCPLFNEEIIAEYEDVLHRAKFRFPKRDVDAILGRLKEVGISSNRFPAGEAFPDPKDVVFYEVALSKDDAYLVTGNTKHFPATPIVVTPAEMVGILEENGLL